MNEQQIREIAETAFKRYFGDVEVVRINVWPGFDHDEDPKVDVKIIYDGKFEKLTGEGLLRVESEIFDKVWWNADDSPGYPILYYIPKSELGRRDPATV